MIGATAKAEQFYTRSGSESTKGSRKGYSLLGDGDNPVSALTDREKRDNGRAALVLEMQKLQVQSIELKLDVSRFYGKGDKYFAARQALVNCQKRMTEIHAIFRETRLKGTLEPKDVRSHFMDAAREILTEAQFKLLMNIASERARKEAQ